MIPALQFFPGRISALVLGGVLLFSATLSAPGEDLSQAPYRQKQLPIQQRVEDLLGRMTRQEKIDQLVLLNQGKDAAAQARDAALIKQGRMGGYIWERENPALLDRYQHIAVENSRLGIPLLSGSDIIHGHRTVFPIALGLACAFDPSLFEKEQTVAAGEARAEGINWVFSPMCDLARDARWGRVAETCGEDPYLGSQCIAAQVAGFQGPDPSAPDRVAACIKHYVGYSAVRAGLDYDSSEISEWVLRNQHLPNFHAGVDAGALTVMSSFNTLNGIPGVANHHTLTDILRGEWRFPGFVVSDWCSISEMISWGFAKDNADAAQLALNAGNDMDMLSGCYQDDLDSDLAQGLVSPATLDQAVRRVLWVKFKLGLFEHPYADLAAYPAALLRPEAVALARECVTKSTVLVKNTGLLPLKKNIRHIALIGPLGDDPVDTMGCWVARGKAETVSTLVQGVKAKLADSAQLQFVAGCPVTDAPPTKTLPDGSVVPDESQHIAPFQPEDAVRAAANADVVIMALGEPKSWTGENASRADLTLPGHQQELFDRIAATGKPIITVIFSGRPLALPEVYQKSQAVLYAWQPGVQGGNGLADLLFGDVSPSGRLSITVPMAVGQCPIYYNLDHTGGHTYGHRTKYMDLGSDAQYWFGHGLTYTTFSYSPVRISPATGGNPAQASVTLTNTGPRNGDEVAQLYIRQMSCHVGVRPEQELRGFQHVPLKPGESKTVSFPLTDKVLGYFDLAGKWRTDAGNYQIWIAPESHSGAPANWTYHP